MKNFTKTLRAIDARINQYLENYILKVTNALYPKPHLEDNNKIDKDESAQSEKFET